MLLPGARALLGENTTNSTTPTPHDRSNSSFNGTGFFMEDEGEEESGFTDIQTVFLACIATLIPLVTILVAGFIIRYLWRKVSTPDVGGYEGVLQREESSDPLGGKSLSASGNILPDELKTSESQFSVTPAEEIQDLTPQSPILSYGGASSGSVPNHTTKSANGSIITMTLKNNHLIVETEEREVPVDNGAVRTTTKFTATSSPHENNVFVVEVQHGADPSPTCYAPTLLYPHVTSSQEDFNEADEEARAQVHRPAEPEPEDDDSDSEADVAVNGEGPRTANTGLSQSDLSVSSAGSYNPSYRYGNQVAYEGGAFGYPEEAPCGEASPTPSVLEKERLQEERLQEEQRVLGNCRVVPDLGEDCNGEALDEVPSLQRSGSLPGKALLVKPRLEDPSTARKRGSLPIITPAMVAIDGTASPEFHRLSDESSPLDEEDYPLSTTVGIPGAVTTAQEYENRAFVSTDRVSS